MNAAIEKKLVLDGLCCTNCAAEIEREVAKIDGVSSAVMNFAAQTLTVDIEDQAHVGRIIEEAGSIIHMLEPDVKVVEKGEQASSRIVLSVSGLHCANCSLQIEQEVKKVSGVKAASLNFAAGKLSIEAVRPDDLEEIVRQARDIAKDIEPGVVIEDHFAGCDERKPSGESIDIKKLIPAGVGILLFAAVSVFKLSRYAELAIYLLSYFLVGGGVVLKALSNIRRGKVFDENFLMVLATAGAFAIGEFPEGAAVMVFYRIGEFFQDMAVQRSRKSIKALMDIRPEYANIVKDGEIFRAAPESVVIGTVIAVKPGEKVPLDGTVIDGTSMLDTSALTGEALPREVSAGDEILSGSVNKNGLLYIKTTKEFSQSAVSRILDLVQNAGSKKAAVESFITKFARYYTPAVVIMAVLLAFIPPIFIRGESFFGWVNRALVFLVVSCPCALVISIPLGFFGGIGGASRRGILIKGGNYLEALNSVDIVVFDKTGTLTKGVFKVTKISPAVGLTGERLMKYAALVESFSNHPVAASIVKAYGGEIDKNGVEGYEEIPGRGVKASINGDTVLAGNAVLMEKNGIGYVKEDALGSVVYVAVDGVFAGSVLVSDEIKEDSVRAVQELKQTGVSKVVMLTGDVRSAGERVAAQLGVDEIYAELLPEQKVEKLEELERNSAPGGKLVFVGDGINDAPVLARADIGVAMGGLGSDAAIEAADIVLMTDEPSRLALAVKIARRTRRIVLQNIVIALGIKAVVLVLGAAGIATMWEAVFADVGVALIAVLNSMRAMSVREKA